MVKVHAKVEFFLLVCSIFYFLICFYTNSCYVCGWKPLLIILFLGFFLNKSGAGVFQWNSFICFTRILDLTSETCTHQILDEKIRASLQQHIHTCKKNTKWWDKKCSIMQASTMGLFFWQRIYGDHTGRHLI